MFYGGYGGPPEKIPHVFSYIFFFHGGEFVVGETGGGSLFSCSGGNQRVRGRRLLGGGGGAWGEFVRSVATPAFNFLSAVRGRCLLVLEEIAYNNLQLQP